MKYVQIKFYLGLFLTLFLVNNALARMPHLLAWQAENVNSSSDDAGCQLCHVNTGGDQPWNAYGWSIKEEFHNNGEDIVAAINTIAFDDADSNPGSDNNDTEIRYNFQPGWTLGPNNTTYSCTSCANSTGDVTQLSGQSPPADLPLVVVVDPPPPLSDPIPAAIPSGMEIALDEVATGFIAPNYATPAPGLSGYLFVVDQVGIIWRVDLSDGSKTVFLDVSAQLVNINTSYDERGLLGLAFHPTYATSGLFYTYQSELVNGAADFSTIPMGGTADHQTVIVQRLADNPGDANTTISVATQEVIRIDQPQSNHNGGMIAFGPTDGYLYISIGDGGFQDDQSPGHSPEGNGQDSSNPLGAILRISPSLGGGYTIPAANNPTSVFGIDEIFASGFRNVWRFSFDSLGNLYAGDVGQNDIEEVSLVENGKNYGWRAKEGSFYFYDNGGASGYVSDTAPPNWPMNLTDPILEYDHDEGISVIGGYIYEGSALTGLGGAYIFGDLAASFGNLNGRLFYSSDLSTFQEFTIQGQAALGFVLMGYGQDHDGELYVMGRPNFNLGTAMGNELGVLMKIVPSGEMQASDEVCIPIRTQNGAIAIICL